MSAPRRQPTPPQAAAPQPPSDSAAAPSLPDHLRAHDDRTHWKMVKPENDPWRHERINPTDPPPIIKRQYGYVPQWILDGTVTTGEKVGGVWHPHVPRHFYDVDRALQYASHGMLPWDESTDGPLPPPVLDEVEDAMAAEDAMLVAIRRDPYATHKFGGHSPCMYKVPSDFGSAFLMGAVGGTAWHGLGAVRHAASGQKWVAFNRAVATRASALGGNFAMWGGLFSTFDCTIKTLRGKVDPFNAIAAGFCTGGVLAIRAGPKAALTSAMVGGALLGLIEGLGFMMGRAGPSNAHQLAPLAPVEMAPAAVGGAASLGSGLLGDEKEPEMERRPVMGAGGIPTGEFKMEPKQRKPTPLVAPTHEFDDEDDDDDEYEEE